MFFIISACHLSEWTAIDCLNAFKTSFIEQTSLPSSVVCLCGFTQALQRTTHKLSLLQHERRNCPKLLRNPKSLTFLYHRDLCCEWLYLVWPHRHSLLHGKVPQNILCGRSFGNDSNCDKTEQVARENRQEMLTVLWWRAQPTYRQEACVIWLNKKTFQCISGLLCCR